MSELQNEEAVIENEVETVEVEDQEIESELATDSEAEHEQKPKADESDAVQKRIDAITREKHNEKRRADELEAKYQALEKEKQEREAAAIGEIPPMPDYLDDDYEQKIIERDNAIARRARFEENQTYNQQQQQLKAQAAMQQKAEANAAIVREHNERVSKMQINADEMREAEAAVLTYGLNPECLEHIIKDKDSPLIVKHLAANPQDGFDLASKSPYEQGLFLNGIKEKAAALRGKKTNTPPPAEGLEGLGVDPSKGKFKNIEGAKFE